MSRSWTLGPPQANPIRLFFWSQLFAKPRYPSKDTNLAGKVAIITGGTTGLGLETSTQLLSLGLSVLIITGRTPEKGEPVAADLRARYPSAEIRFWTLEMTSYPSVQAFAARVRDEPLLSRLDLVILNAGMQVLRFAKVPDTGHETLIQVNYLSTVLLALLLLPLIRSRAGEKPGRLTIVSSGTARGAVLPVDSLDKGEGDEEHKQKTKARGILASLDDATKWNPVTGYAVSKLLGHLFLAELVAATENDAMTPYVDGSSVTINLVDPAMVKNTELQRGSPLPVAAFFWTYKAIFGRTLSQGASTYVDASVVKGKDSHGCVIANWEISSFAAFLYTPEGRKARKQLWQETMAELEFAGVGEILAGLRH